MNRLRLFFNHHKNITCCLLFAAFMLIQLITLRLSNRAGWGVLPVDAQERTYIYNQVVVIAGFLIHILIYARLKKKGVYNTAVCAMHLCCAAGAGIMLFASEGSLFYMILSAVAVLCLGFIGGAIYYKMSAFFASGARVGAAFGIAYASAVALQYLFQLEWTLKPVLLMLLAASFAVCVLIFHSGKTELFSEAETKADGTKKSEKRRALRSKQAFCVVITLAMLVFITYYNSYIHHLQIASGFTDYNVYKWPRLLMIPVVILLGLIGDIKGGKFLPIGRLCIAVISLLNTALAGRETYYLNMSLYYVSLSAVVAYYNLTFFRLAPVTRRPVLWASVGRMLDSLFVVVSFALSFFDFSAVTVLVIEIAALVAAVVFMAWNGDFIFTAPALSPAEEEAVDPFSAIEEEYGVSAGEMKVLRELVLTDDKQEAVAAKLHISVSTLRHHVTSIYRKTNTQSRLALCSLVQSKRKK